MYPKAEVDEAIAELKDKLHDVDNQWNKQCKEIAELKAELCEARYDEEDARVNGRGASWDYISNKMKYWERWRWRWEALAEKFKEAK